MRQNGYRCLHFVARSLAVVIVATAALVSGGSGVRQVCAQPAKLTVEGPSGATVHIDGKRVGTTPLPKPIELEPGKRFVSVAKNGFVAHGQQVELERGKATTLRVDLRATRQRIASWVLLGTGGAGIAAGITLGVLSVVELRKAREIEQATGDGGLSERQQLAYDAALSARDDFRLGSGIAAGTGLGLFLVGGALLVLESASAASTAGAGHERSGPDAVKGRDSSASRAGAVMLPLVGPGLAGATIVLRF